MMMEESEWIK